MIWQTLIYEICLQRHVTFSLVIFVGVHYVRRPCVCFKFWRKGHACLQDPTKIDKSVSSSGNYSFPSFATTAQLGIISPSNSRNHLYSKFCTIILCKHNNTSRLNTHSYTHTRTNTHTFIYTHTHISHFLQLHSSDAAKARKHANSVVGSAREEVHTLGMTKNVFVFLSIILSIESVVWRGVAAVGTPSCQWD